MAGVFRAPELRVVLVGKTGAGKSAAGNTILGDERFMSCMSCFSVTTICEKQETLRDGRRIVVVDTPGFFDTDHTEDETAEEVRKCIRYSTPGPHAIIHVLQLGLFSEQEKKINSLIHKALSLKAKAYMIMLFTRKEDLGGRTLKEFISIGDKDLKEQVAACGGRCIAFNNRADGEEKEAQVEDLIQMIDALVQKNSHIPCYTEDMLNKDKAESKSSRRSRCSLL